MTGIWGRCIITMATAMRFQSQSPHLTVPMHCWRGQGCRNFFEEEAYTKSSRDSSCGGKVKVLFFCQSSQEYNWKCVGPYWQPWCNPQEYLSELSNFIDCTSIMNSNKLPEISRITVSPPSPLLSPPSPATPSCSEVTYVTVCCTRKCLRAAIEAQDCRCSPDILSCIPGYFVSWLENSLWSMKQLLQSPLLRIAYPQLFKILVITLPVRWAI